MNPALLRHIFLYQALFGFQRKKKAERQKTVTKIKYGETIPGLTSNCDCGGIIGIPNSAAGE